jgi:peptide/nickel transport system substrate-binding protein
MIFEYLQTIGPTGKVEPGLARSVTRIGRNVYVYHLRHGAKFWDGDEVTADDVANSLNYDGFPISRARPPSTA